MRIAALQTDIIWEQPAANFERLTPMLAARVPPAKPVRPGSIQQRLEHAFLADRIDQLCQIPQIDSRLTRIRLEPVGRDHPPDRRPALRRELLHIMSVMSHLQG